MIQLHVTPEEFIALQILADSATRTLDGHVDTSIWINGIRDYVGQDVFDRLPVYDDIQLIIEYDGNIEERITTSTEIT